MPNQENVVADKMVASDIVLHNTVEYGKHILSNHFTSPIDGMKKVRRRIVYTQPADSEFSGSKLISNTIEIHNYGDASIYDAATKMCESFRSSFPLLILIGKGGSYSGVKAAHSRYTKFRLSPFCKDIFLNGINFKTIPMVMTEDLSGQEIKYFIPKLPTALLFGNESIGFGYKSSTMPLALGNVCDLVIDYAKCKNKDSWNYTRLAAKFVPFFPIHIFIKNKAELIRSYRKGNFNTPVVTEGLYDIESNNSVLIRTLSYGTPTMSVRESIIRCLSDKKHWLVGMDANLKPLSSGINYVDFHITVKRGCNVFELMDKLKPIVKLRSKFYPFNNYVFEDMLLKLDPPTILKMWYKERYRSILGAKKHRQQILQREIMKIETYLIICEHVDEVIGIIRNPKYELKEIYSKLKGRFELSLRQCEILVNAKLLVLSKMKRVELEANIARLSTELNEITESFGSIDQEVYTEVAKLKQKYKPDPKFSSREIEYIGCLLIEGYGVIQLTHLDEVMKYARMFKQPYKTFIKYPKRISSITLTKPGTATYENVFALPHTSFATSVNLISPDIPYYFIRSKDRINRRKQVDYSRDVVVNPISNKPWICDKKKGIVSNVDSEVLAKNPRSKSNILYAFDPVKGEKHVVISINTANNNTIRLQVVKSGSKLLLNGAGKTTVVAVLPVSTKRCIINLVNHPKYSLIDVPDLSKFIKDDLLDINLRSFTKKI